MYFTDNFNENSMLFAQPVFFEVYNDENKLVPLHSFMLRLPTFKDVYFNIKIMHLMGFLQTPISELKKQFESFLSNFNSHYELLLKATILHNKTLVLFLNGIAEGFYELGVNIQFGSELNPGNITIDDWIIGEQIFERLRQICLIAAALKKKSDFINDPQMQAMQERIDRIKNKNKAVKSMEKGDFKESFMILTYEFNYKPDEILNMTPYAITTILGYTSGSIRYKISVVAAGNGLTKKVKFITDKGK